MRMCLIEAELKFSQGPIYGVWGVGNGCVGEGAAVAETDIKGRDLSMRMALEILQEEAKAKECQWL